MVREVARQVEEVRGLSFRRPVAAEAVTREELAGYLRRATDDQFVGGRMSRRSLAWGVIGAVPEGTDLRRAIRDYQGTQVIGLYDTVTGRLLFVGDDSPSPLGRLTLAHELTHALEDQRFELSRGDRLLRTCRDERFAAFTALVEGSATETALRWAGRYLSVQDLLEVQAEVAGLPPPPASVPAFVREMFQAPYLDGQRFVRALLERGGQRELDRAFVRPPVSTEQVLHPDRYPRDRPRAVHPPDLVATLGRGWKEIDALDVGESWLRALLDLRLTEDRAEAAAAGWDGGRYRAFRKGPEVVVVMDTAWDTGAEAAEFARAVASWAAGRPVLVRREGPAVRVVFASGRATLEAAGAVPGP